MLETKKTVMLCTANQYNRCIWRWDEQTLEGAFLPKKLWECVPSNRLMLAARDGLRYTLLHGSLVSDQTGRLTDDEIDDFRIAMQDDGVYVEFIVQGKPILIPPGKSPRLKTSTASFGSSFPRALISLRFPLMRLPRSCIFSTIVLENVSASSLLTKCCTCLDNSPRQKTSRFFAGRKDSA